MKITLITGPMFSGKSTELLRLAERGLRGKRKVCLIRPQLDNRPYLTHTEATNVHFGFFNIPTYWFNAKDCDKNLEYVEEIFEHDTICIDEIQFFKGIKTFVYKLITLSTVKEPGRKIKHLFLAGLISDSECNTFKETVEILPFCDEVIKLNAVCQECGNDEANYSYYEGKKSQVKVGGIFDYQALCVNCYMGKVHTNT